MLRGSFSNWLGLLVTGAINLILTPILIRELGDFHYGIWVLVYSVVIYYGLLDFGMYTTSLRFVAKARGAHDRQRLNQIFVTSLGITSVLAVVTIFMTGLLVWLIPYLLDLSGASRTLFRWVLFLLGLGFAITSLNQLLGNYLCGLNRFGLFNLAKIATSCVRAAMMLLALYLGYGLVGLAWAILMAAFFSWPLYWFLVRRADRSLVIQVSAATWPRVRELMGFGFFSYLTTVGNYARFYLDSLVIARVLKVTLITPFSVAAQPVEYFRMILQGVMSPLITSFSSLVGQQCSREVLQAMFLRATKFTSLLSLLVGSLLFFNGQTFIRLWVGDRFLPSYNLLAILTVGYVLLLSQGPSNALLYALSKHRAMAAWTLAEGFANLSLSVYLAPSYGLVGIALGTAIPMVVVAMVVQPWYVLRLLGLSVRVYVWQALARPLATWGLFAVVCQLVPPLQACGSLFDFLWAVGWQTALFAVLACTIGLGASERRLLYERGKQFAAGLRPERT